MSKDPQLSESLKRLAGPVDRRGVWSSLEARAAAERARHPRARRRRFRIACAVGAVLVVLAGAAVGWREVVKHQGQVDYVFTDDTSGAGATGSTTPPYGHMWQGGPLLGGLESRPGIAPVGWPGRVAWQQLPLSYEGAEIDCLAIDERDPAVLFASSAVGVLYKSTDGAATWTKTGELSRIDSIAIDPQQPSTIVVVGSTGGSYQPQVLRSLDGGATWEDLSGALQLADPVTGSLSVGNLVFNGSLSPETLSVNTGTGWWISTDKGTTWLKLAEGELPEPETSPAIHTTRQPSDPIVDAATGDSLPVLVGGSIMDLSDQSTQYAATVFGVYKSTNGGATWNYASTGLTSTDVGSLVIDPRSPVSTMYAATPMGIFKSTDVGSTWTAVLGGGAGNTSDSAWWASGSVVIAPSDPSIVYARTTLGLFRSDDGAASWNLLPVSGLPSVNAPMDGISDPLLLVVADDPNVVFVSASSDGIYRSADGGNTWAKVIRATGKLVQDPNDPSTMYALVGGRDQVLEPGIKKDTVMKSTDRGATWSVAAGPRKGTVLDLVTDYSDPARLYLIEKADDASGPVTVSRSSDGGDTWETTDIGASLPSLTSLLFERGEPGIVYATTGGTIGQTTNQADVFMSADGGTTWQSTSLPEIGTGAATLVHDPIGTAVYAVSPSGCFRWDRALSNEIYPSARDASAASSEVETATSTTAISAAP